MLQIYVYNNHILLSKVRQFCPFLENFPFDEDEPGCQYKTFGNGLTAHQMASTPIPMCTSNNATGIRM